jgi:hypothetical protein
MLRQKKLAFNKAVSSPQLFRALLEELRLALASLRKSAVLTRPSKIDDSKFGQRKYNRGHKVKGRWVFGGVKREYGKTFLVPVPDNRQNLDGCS